MDHAVIGDSQVVLYRIAGLRLLLGSYMQVAALQRVVLCRQVIVQQIVLHQDRAGAGHAGVVDIRQGLGVLCLQSQRFQVVLVRQDHLCHPGGHIQFGAAGGHAQQLGAILIVQQAIPGGVMGVILRHRVGIGDHQTAVIKQLTVKNAHDAAGIHI